MRLLLRLIHIIICNGLLFSSQALMASPQQCTAPTINNQCNSLDVDQSGETGALIPTNAFNPIDLFTGNKYLREVDLYAHPQSPDLEVVRHYNAMSTNYGALGGSWTLSYDAQLLITDSSKLKLQLRQANGTVRTLNATHGHLERQSERLIWHYHNGDSWHFNQAGWLIQLQRQNQDPVFIHRHTDADADANAALQHKIATVQQGPYQLRFEYSNQDKHTLPLLQQVHSRSGSIQYRYESTPDSELQRLTEAHYPDQRQLHYHYETQYQQNNPWAITGKSIKQNQNSSPLRVRSWVYDPQGRAFFYMAEQPQHWVKIDFPNRLHNRQTQLHSQNGITYVDFVAANDSQPRIQAVSGAQCWACPPPMQRTPTSVQFGKTLKIHHAIHNENQIKTITGQFMGWPDLRLDYDHQGKLIAWQHALQQRTELFYKNNKAHRMQFANGDEQQVEYNALQQVNKITYKKAQQQIITTVSRPSPRHLHVHHPNETEKLLFNAHNKIIKRQIQRQLHTPSGTVQWHYAERFIYDENHPHRLIKHLLPEGGALHYLWTADEGELEAIEWENSEGIRRNVIKKTPKGHEYSNGLLQLKTHSSDGNRHQLLLQNPHAAQPLWWQQELLLEKGLVIEKMQKLPIINHAADPKTTQYIYNPQKQLAITKSSQKSADFYHWDNSGALAAHNKKHVPVIKRDASGLATNWQHKAQDYILRYNAMRQLDVVYNSVDTVQKNSQNAAGFRIYAQHYPQATQQFFLYHNKKIVAEYSAAFSAKLPVHAAHPVTRRYIYLENQPVGLIDYKEISTGELLVMHSDHLGAVHIISDVDKTVRWAATYDAFGAATQLAGDEKFTFNLRREGQYFDMSTGWHYNLLRTYLPEQGQYLEPDPLGPNPTTQLLGYAKQQPLNHTDPWGLILFAFDGTRYDESSGGVVHALHKASIDPSSYVAGPGNPDEVDWDAMVAYSTKQIIDRQWQYLEGYLNYAQHQMPTTTIPIDIIGFSRGSAIALHFANQIIKYTNNGLFSYKNRYGVHIQTCIQPRFMGLLDTVAQMGILGFKNHHYDFTVAPAWQWVVHGVALHEHRDLFPLHTIGTNSNSQEAALVGSHADLGGGYPLVDDPNFSPLSDVALQWLAWNARAQGMQFNDIELKENTEFAYMHDESHFLEITRVIRNHEPTLESLSPAQSFHPIYGEKTREQTKHFLDYKLSKEEEQGSRKAKVDLSAYYRWLDETINWSPE